MKADYADKAVIANITSEVDKTAVAYCLEMGISFLIMLQKPGYVNVCKVGAEVSTKLKKISDLYTFFMERIDTFR